MAFVRCLLTLKWINLTIYFGYVVGQSFPTIDDYNDSTVATSFIKDDFWKMIMEKQLLYCPYEIYCSPMFHRNVLHPVTSCCASCNCDIRSCALQANCCPSLLIPNVTQYESFLQNPINLPESEIECISPQVLNLKENLNADKSYVMFTACPFGYKDSNISIACEKGQFLQKDDDEINFPVTSNATLKVYKNQNCAVCHGEIPTNLVLWKTGLVCEHNLPSYSFQDVKTFVFDMNICNIVFVPPTPVPECNWGMISSCNITGQWIDYDEKIEKACHSYTSIYMNKFRNVFCAICNGEPDMYMDCWHLINPPSSIEEFSFTAILDFVDKTPTDVVKVDKCKENEIIDEFMNECLPMFCDQMMDYDAENNNCSARFHLLSNVKYNVTVAYKDISNETPCSNCTEEIVSSIYKELKNFLDKNGFRSNLCEVNFLFEPELMNHLLITRYLIVQFSFYVEGLHDYEKTVQLMIEHFKTKASVTASNGITYIFMRSILGKNGWPRIWGGMHVDSSLNLFISPDNRLFHLFIHYEEYMYYHCASEIILQVSPLLLCPQIKLPASLEYKTKPDLVIDKSDHSISSGYFEIKPYTNNVMVCFESYKLATSKIRQPVLEVSALDKAEGIVSLVCICITIVSLVVTIVTYALFKNLRTAPGLNNMTLSIMLLVANILFGFSSHFSHLKLICEIIGALTHLFWLSSIVWMNICCIHMFNVFKSIDKAVMDDEIFPRFYKYLLYSCLVPILFMCVNIIYSETVKGDIGYGEPICYIRYTLMNLVTFALPVALIIISNIIMFVVVVIKIRSMKDAPTSTAHKLNFSIYAKLSTLTGITWVLGYVYELSGVRFFSFAFIILCALQGFFIMLAFICNKRVWKLYRTLIKEKKFPTTLNRSTQYKQNTSLHSSQIDHVHHTSSTSDHTTNTSI